VRFVYVRGFFKFKKGRNNFLKKITPRFLEKRGDFDFNIKVYV